MIRPLNLADDFDWFAPAVARPEALAATIRDAAPAVDNLDLAAGTVNCRIGGVKVQFLEFAYPLLAQPDAWPTRDKPWSPIPDPCPSPSPGA